MNSDISKINRMNQPYDCSSYICILSLRFELKNGTWGNNNKAGYSRKSRKFQQGNSIFSHKSYYSYPELDCQNKEPYLLCLIVTQQMHGRNGVCQCIKCKPWSLLPNFGWKIFSKTKLPTYLHSFSIINITPTYDI